MAKILQMPLGPLETNCYLLGCQTTNIATIIDPSFDGKTIYEAAQREGFTIESILLTHSHFDHVGGLAELKQLTKAPIYIHAEAVPMLQQAARSARIWNIILDEPPAHDELLTEGQQLQVGELRLETLYTPGHAPGHVSFYAKEHDLIFSGDVLFRQSIGRTDLPGGDYNLLIDMIKTKLLPLPDKTQVLSGHGPVTTIGQEKQWNPFLSGRSEIT